MQWNAEYIIILFFAQITNGYLKKFGFGLSVGVSLKKHLPKSLSYLYNGIGDTNTLHCAYLS